MTLQGLMKQGTIVTLWSPMETRDWCDTPGPHGSKGISIRSGWLGLTGPNALGKSSISSHVPLKHWNSELSFKWKRTVLLIQAPTAKIGFPL